MPTTSATSSCRHASKRNDEALMAGCLAAYVDVPLQLPEAVKAEEEALVGSLHFLRVGQQAGAQGLQPALAAGRLLPPVHLA
jgi:hypothetical protein